MGINAVVWRRAFEDFLGGRGLNTDVRLQQTNAILLGRRCGVGALNIESLSGIVMLTLGTWSQWYTGWLHLNLDRL